MNPIPEELRDLIDEYLSGEIETPRFERLQAWLSEDPQARAYFVRYCQMELQLYVDMRAERAADHAMRRIWELAGERSPEDSVATDVAGLQAEVDSAAAKHPFPSGREVGSEGGSPKSPVLGFLGDGFLGNVGRQSWGYISDHTLLFSILALLAFAGLVAEYSERWVPGVPARGSRAGEQEAGRKDEIAANPKSSVPDLYPSPQSPAPSPSSASPARLVRVKDCHWNGQSSAPEVGQSLSVSQPLSLASGVAEIEFDIGAKVILQSPANFQLLSANSARLEMGKATVEIKNERARGFKILTPETTFVDQGTEFGVEVAPGGSSKVHVFRGLVDVERKARDGQTAPPTHRLVENVGARMESGEDGMTLVEDTGECFIRSMDEADRDRHVVAYWRFEDRPLGTVLPHTTENKNPVRATTDSSFNGNDLFVWHTQQPRISGDVPAGAIPQTGAVNRGCLNNLMLSSHELHPDLYTRSQFSHAAPLDIQTIAPAQWTIEVSVKARSLDGPAGVAMYGKEQTFVGRDGCRQSVSPKSPDWISPRLAFQITAAHCFAISFADPQNRFHRAVAEQLPLSAAHWYNLAATSDGRALRLYVDDGQGYRLQAETALPTTGSTALACSSSDGEWSIGRGRDRVLGGPGQFFDGRIDEVRISDIAREPAEFLFTLKEQGKEKRIAKR